MTEATDVALMKIALRAARSGDPSPNPHVGAVIARGGKVLAKGFHARAGHDHAEVAALKNLKESAEGSCLYVTLEPCNHFGRTGPCSEAIIAAGIRRVVIGCEDPVTEHSGGAQKLREAGLEVKVGVLRSQAERLLESFSKHALTGMPHVTLKAAVTLDGRMASRTGDSRWITGRSARVEAHRMRAWSDAIMVGRGTVDTDDPALTVRHVRGRSPVRVVIDSNLKMLYTARLFDAPLAAPVWIFHAQGAEELKRKALQQSGARLTSVPTTRVGLDLRFVLRELAKRNIVRLLVEGGPTLHGSLLAEGLVDRVSVFMAPRILGDPHARALAVVGERLRISEALDLGKPRIRRFGNDILLESHIESSNPNPENSFPV